MLNVLLKKQLTEKFAILKKGKRQVDYLGALLTILLSGFLIAVIIVVLSRFLLSYSQIRIDGIKNVVGRQFELSTIVYSVIFLLAILSGIKQINFAIFESEDREIFSTLPIKPTTIFYSKLIVVYFKQVVFYFLSLLPVNIAFQIAQNNGAYYIIMTLLICLLAPLLTLSIASAFCLPVYLIKKFFNSKYITTLIISTIVVGVLFWGYSEILRFVESLMATGDIKFFFKEATMQGIINATTWLYPANVTANILLKINTGKNIGIFIAFVVGFSVLGYFLVSTLFSKAQKAKTTNLQLKNNCNKVNFTQSPVVLSLLKKEFVQIIRTPSYAFQYFSVAAIMPLMVYFCMGIGSDLLSSLIMINSNFELALFLILIFSALTNTFCATNISREGPAFYTLKTLPISIEKVVLSKILFCSIVTTLSTLIACILVGGLHFISWGNALFIFFVATLVSEAQICFATRKDLNRPMFPTNDDCEVKESSNTMSIIIVLGLIIAVILGGVSLLLSIKSNMNQQNDGWKIMLFTGLTSSCILIVSLVYLITGLKKKCYLITEGN